LEEIFEEEGNEGNVGNEGNLGVLVEEIFEEGANEGNGGINVEEYFEEEVVNVGGDNAEGVNEGNVVEGEVDFGANGDGNMGPTLLDDVEVEVLQVIQSVIL